MGFKPGPKHATPCPGEQRSHGRSGGTPTCRCWISSVNGGGFLNYGYLGDINTMNGEKNMDFHGISWDFHGISWDLLGSMILYDGIPSGKR